MHEIRPQLSKELNVVVKKKKQTTQRKIVPKIIHIQQKIDLKTESHDVIVSTIILRRYDTKLNKKGCEENSPLKKLCEEKNVCLIENSKRIKPQHINKGKIHLNKNGSKIFVK